MFNQFRETAAVPKKSPVISEESGTGSNTGHEGEAVSRLEQILFGDKSNRTDHSTRAEQRGRIRSRFKPIRPTVVSNEPNKFNDSNHSTGTSNGRSMPRCVSTPELSAKKKPEENKNGLSHHAPANWPVLRELIASSESLSSTTVKAFSSPQKAELDINIDRPTIQKNLDHQHQLRKDYHLGRSGKENLLSSRLLARQHDTPLTTLRLKPGSISEMCTQESSLVQEIKREGTLELQAFKRPFTASKAADNIKPPPEPVELLLSEHNVCSPEKAWNSFELPKSTLYKTPVLCTLKPTELPAQVTTPVSPLSRLPTLVVKDKCYYVVKELGQGGFSKVYQVLDVEQGQLMALKVVELQGLDESLVQSCLQEIALLKQLKNSPYIVQLHDFQLKQAEKKLFVVMEQGETDLANVFKAETLQPWSVKHYWHKMLLAVEFIHQQGIVHMDLKPANFLLVCGKLKLIDFGIAATIQEDFTSVVKESQAGTYNFMAPEVIEAVAVEKDGCFQQGVKFNTKADIWSLGCILYAMIYGHSPFQHIRTVLGKMQAIIDNKHQIPFPPGPTPEAIDVMKSCLQRNPKVRPIISDLLQHAYLQS